MRGKVGFGMCEPSERRQKCWKSASPEMQGKALLGVISSSPLFQAPVVSQWFPRENGISGGCSERTRISNRKLNACGLKGKEVPSVWKVVEIISLGNGFSRLWVYPSQLLLVTAKALFGLPSHQHSAAPERITLSNGPKQQPCTSTSQAALAAPPSKGRGRCPAPEVSGRQ